jgi:hypothetical protein
MFSLVRSRHDVRRADRPGNLLLGQMPALVALTVEGPIGGAGVEDRALADALLDLLEGLTSVVRRGVGVLDEAGDVAHGRRVAVMKR